MAECLHTIHAYTSVLRNPGLEIMLELMRKAVGFVFMTTVRLGGGISGMGGTGLVISRLQDGSWNEVPG